MDALAEHLIFILRYKNLSGTETTLFSTQSMFWENNTAGPETATGDSLPSFTLKHVRSGVSLLTVVFWRHDRAVKQARPGNNSTLPQEPPCSPLKALLFNRVETLL